VGNNISANGNLDRYYGEGWIYLGSLRSNSSGYFNGTINVSNKGVDWYCYLTATATKNGTSEFGRDYQLFKPYDVNAIATLHGSNLTIEVKAYRDMRDVTVYWIKPKNVEIKSVNIPYNSEGDYYWWTFDSLSRGEVKTINLSLNRSTIDCTVVGVDPEVMIR